MLDRKEKTQMFVNDTKTEKIMWVMMKIINVSLKKKIVKFVLLIFVGKIQ